eukprot:SM001664S02646  [mRNA]  locus=s1664:4:757:+ [translate_table: standard]
MPSRPESTTSRLRVGVAQDLPEQHREDAVASLVYEAQARVQDPVYGCVGILCVLQKQVAYLRTQLALCQAQAQGRVPSLPALVDVSVVGTDSPQLKEQHLFPNQPALREQQLLPQ